MSPSLDDPHCENDQEFFSYLNQSRVLNSSSRDSCLLSFTELVWTMERNFTDLKDSQGDWSVVQSGTRILVDILQNCVLTCKDKNVQFSTKHVQASDCGITFSSLFLTTDKTQHTLAHSNNTHTHTSLDA